MIDGCWLSQLLVITKPPEHARAVGRQPSTARIGKTACVFERFAHICDLDRERLALVRWQYLRTTTRVRVLR
jgi:hypothetical protein